jgi:small-conductance mechanosensitive channel
MRFVINVFVISVGAILWMEAVHIPVTPVVAAFGVVGLAAGLALWETLSNLFAGLYIILDRRIRVGDYVKVQGAEEGFVESIGWRSLRIVTTQNDLVIIPNRRLADSVVTNCSLPQPTSIAMIEVQVDSSVEVDRVTQILQDEVKGAVKALAGAVPEQIPLVRFSNMTPQHLTFQIAVGIQNVLDRMNVQSELRKLALNCLRRHAVPPWKPASESALTNGDAEETKTRKRKKV